MELLTPDEVIRILKITKRTLYHYTKTGIIPFVRLQRRIRFRREDIEQFIQTRLSKNPEVDDIVISIKRKIQKALKES
ncbi:MAG: helix-turn-helix domain-containing protein [Thermodesulfovibrio sp.]|nr:helix-turn-helix domain-containing protein [Thermodesulfovibrio sp.]